MQICCEKWSPFSNWNGYGKDLARHVTCYVCFFKASIKKVSFFIRTCVYKKTRLIIVIIAVALSIPHSVTPLCDPAGNRFLHSQHEELRDDMNFLVHI